MDDTTIMRIRHNQQPRSIQASYLPVMHRSAYDLLQIRHPRAIWLARFTLDISRITVGCPSLVPVHQLSRHRASIQPARPVRNPKNHPSADTETYFLGPAFPNPSGCYPVTLSQGQPMGNHIVHPPINYPGSYTPEMTAGPSSPDCTPSTNSSLQMPTPIASNSHVWSPGVTNTRSPNAQGPMGFMSPQSYAHMSLMSPQSLPAGQVSLFAQPPSR